MITNAKSSKKFFSSRLMSTFAITSHQYTITLYTSGHLQISWDVFAKKSADFMSFGISFITVSSWKQSHYTEVEQWGIFIRATHNWVCGYSLLEIYIQILKPGGVTISNLVLNMFNRWSFSFKVCHHEAAHTYTYNGPLPETGIGSLILFKRSYHSAQKMASFHSS